MKARYARIEIVGECTVKEYYVNPSNNEYSRQCIKSNVLLCFPFLFLDFLVQSYLIYINLRRDYILFIS